MLLAIDAGNSAVKLGLFRASELLKTWRLDRGELRTTDEHGVQRTAVFDLSGIDPKNVDAIIISSVVPELNHILQSLAEQYFKVTPLFVDHTTNTGLTNVSRSARFLPTEISQTKTRTPTPTCGAANPIPGAAYIVWIMSSMSVWISGVIASTVAAG